MPRALLVLSIALLCQGCFVFDELDKGQKIMDQHSPRNRVVAEAASKVAPPRPAKEEPGLLAGWWTSAQAWWTELRQPAPTERAASDIVVRCQVGERMQYTRKSDCEVRGGRIL